MKTIRTVHLAILLFSLLVGACVAPVEKELDQDASQEVENIKYVDDDEMRQVVESAEEQANTPEKEQVQVVTLPEALNFDLSLEEPSANTQLEEVIEPEAQLPKGIQQIDGELNADSTAQYHIASAAELEAGRKENKDIARFLQLGLQPTIYFAFNQATLNEDSQAILFAYVEAFFSQSSGNNNVSLTFEGHTDYVGTTDYNLSLGLRRALSIKDFMIAQGVDASRLEVESFGEERPVFEDFEQEYQRYNRRVEIYFTHNKK